MKIWKYLVYLLNNKIAFRASISQFQALFDTFETEIEFFVTFKLDLYFFNECSFSSNIHQ